VINNVMSCFQCYSNDLGHTQENPAFLPKFLPIIGSKVIQVVVDKKETSGCSPILFVSGVIGCLVAGFGIIDRDLPKGRCAV